MSSTNRRPGYREPTRAEAAHFAAINSQWLKMRRRQRRRKAVQGIIAGLLIAVVGALGAAMFWLLAVGIIIAFDGITNL